jgi:hypothetical protein
VVRDELDLLSSSTSSRAPNPPNSPPRDIWEPTPYRHRDELDLLSGSTSSLGGPFGSSKCNGKTRKGPFHTFSTSVSENDSGRRNHHLRSNTATSIVIPAATAISHGTDTGVYPGIQPMSTPERGPPIKFNHTGELSGFVNHSPHRVLYGNKMYPTAMHVLEALKFTRHPYMQERIRAHGDVGYVYPLSVSFQEYVRPGWGKLFLSAVRPFHSYRSMVPSPVRADGRCAIPQIQTTSQPLCLADEHWPF